MKYTFVAVIREIYFKMLPSAIVQPLAYWHSRLETAMLSVITFMMNILKRKRNVRVADTDDTSFVGVYGINSRRRRRKAIDFFVKTRIPKLNLSKSRVY